MAITTNHTIDTTLRKAIDYILNPDKTDAKLLVHAYACTPEIADKGNTGGSRCQAD